MHKVLIASKSESENILIQKRLVAITEKVGEIDFFGTRPVSVPSLIDARFSLLIYNCQHFSSAFRGKINHWRSLGYLGPIMLIAKVPDPKQIDHFLDIQNLTVIEKPYENRDFQGIAMKYLTASNVEQRRFRRFYTRQKATLESYTKNYNSESLISNISRGGAHITGELGDLTKGDLIRVNFELNELNRNRTMSAEVVWTSGNESQNDRSAGLRFVPKSKVYDSLLHGI